MALARKAALAYGLSVGALVAYNVRWRWLFASHKARRLPVSVAEGDPGHDNKRGVAIVLLHGMWHDPCYFEGLQAMLSKRGYSSYAVSLLPGERVLPGGSQTELVRDLEFTLRELGVQRLVLVGHSQGGLLAQSAILRSTWIAERCAAAVLMGTGPLGTPPPPLEILRRPRNMYNHLGFAYICAFGKLMSMAYCKHIFLLPTTDETTPAMQEYMRGILAAPSNGLITSTHFFFPVRMPISATIPALVLGGSDDIIYPPDLLKEAFDARFPHPKTTHLVAQRQAHCFVDPGWETSVATPLLDWIDGVVAV